MQPTQTEGRRQVRLAPWLFAVLFAVVLASAPATAQIDPGMKGWALVTGHWSKGAPDSLAWLDLATWKLATQIDGSTSVADPQPQPWIPVAGDWDGSGVDAVKMFDPSTWRVVAAADGPIAVTVDPEPQPWIPVAGDWDGRGVDTIRVVDLRDGSVHKIEEGPTPVERYDPEPQPWIPVAGDWDGKGIDTVAQVRREGAVDAWQVVAGDWDGDGVDTVALVHRASGKLVESAGDSAPLSKAKSTASSMQRALSDKFSTGPGVCYTVIKNAMTVYKVFHLQDGGVIVVKISSHELWTCCPIDIQHQHYACGMQLVFGS